MRWDEAAELLLKTLRLYHDPVAVFFLRGDEEFRPEARPKNRLSICQYLAHVREVGESLLLLPENLHCQTAAFVVGFPYREQNVMKTLHKFLQPEAAERLYRERPRLKEGEFRGFGFVPLAKAYRDPEVVLMVVDTLQAAHLLDFYLYGAGLTEIPLSHYPNAAVCGSMVKAYLTGYPVMSFPCPGAFSSGKMDRGELILAFPGEAFKIVLRVLEEKAREGKVSFLGGPRLVGEDICRNCPLITFGPPGK
ncbi:DUF169 domain-containing protein [Thermosulfurimonas dismutans]|uniref:DUF169 domain-containing protein n=1 Tax=Thermosulfurimonas dismutans TaxID=999894 RepID=A0A179D856_9BACT|nr:DUF169 domain-containing protein [Thermosulfurimonas dismutans]OAQ21622.1 hypothetical protein TDIS_0140 [Thermosulfurimonas dismutans]